ncbi:unnamed protein product [Didymodactylos carnosus]|uniref:Uncharacterized protein n=1 Tax=Didymodactylos carnosus TaxID=1234261 RepID=A0A8S2EEJ0_9BILA|nr:unnamed protein product [Didymodactylos carnosus]CAF4016064.1 unnamed protein product [Didymodactylos carnosus]
MITGLNNANLMNFNKHTIRLMHYNDLYQQLKRIHLEYYDNKIVRVYIGQSISKIELDHIKTSIGDLISINSFFLTTTNRELSFIHGGIDVSADNDLVNILLEINIDKHLKSLSKPFADISMGSHFHDEQEVLFYIGTIFKIKMIEQKNDIWLIELDVCTDDDNNELFCQIKNEIINDQGDIGKLLLKIGEYDEAKVYYQQLLNHQQQDYRKFYHVQGELSFVYIITV